MIHRKLTALECRILTHAGIKHGTMACSTEETEGSEDWSVVTCPSCLTQRPPAITIMSPPGLT